MEVWCFVEMLLEMLGPVMAGGRQTGLVSSTHAPTLDVGGGRRPKRRAGKSREEQGSEEGGKPRGRAGYGSQGEKTKESEKTRKEN